MSIPDGFRGRAKRLDDIDLPRIGAMIGAGEDEIHAVLDVESRGSGFDGQGRPLILFEPHIFWRLLKLQPEKQAAAVKAGLAYERWGTRPYRDSYPRLVAAMKIDETAALQSCSWGLGQVLGANFRAAGYPSIHAMVAAMCDDEENHLAAMVNFIRANRLDDAIRRHDWARFARGYNGPGYAKNRYDTRLAASYARWKGIKDTPWRPRDAAAETAANDVLSPNVTATPLPPSIAVTLPTPRPAPTRPAAPLPTPVEAPSAPAPPAPRPGFFSRFLAALSRRLGG